MVSKPGGLEFKPQSPYSTACNYFCLQKSIRWTHVTQTSGAVEWRSPGWHVVGRMLKPDKYPLTPSISPEFYSWTDTEDLPIEL
jgi:hypothetical protein